MKISPKLFTASALFLATVLLLTPPQLTGQIIHACLRIQAANAPLSLLQAGDFVSLGQMRFVKVNQSDNLLLLDGTYVDCPAVANINYAERTCTCKQSGYNYRSVDKTCISCPAYSVWQPQSEVCACNANYYMNNNACSACPANSSSSAGSTAISQCTCDSGYNRKSDNTCVSCPSNSTWNTTSEICQCVANKYMSDNTCVSCPSNSTSPAGSTAISACSCNANYYKQNNACTACPTNSTSSAGSTAFSACKCKANYYMSGSACVSCPANSTSTAGAVNQCTCNSGYNWIASDITCKQCPAGSTYNSASKTCVCGSGYSYNAENNICYLSNYEKVGCDYPTAYMQDWDACSSLALHETVCLEDQRDHRTYQVRKLADGNCWMVDSLKLGGDYVQNDGCAANDGMGNVASGGSTSVTKARETFATGYYGHCRAIPGWHSDNYYHDMRSYNNYLYDWVAAMQSTSAYNGSWITFTPPQQGICPSGWHLPTGFASGEFGTLLNAYCGATSSCYTTDLQNAAKGNFTLSGNCSTDHGVLESQGFHGDYWSSTSALYVLGFIVDYSDRVSIDDAIPKSVGLAVRCVKD